MKLGQIFVASLVIVFSAIMLYGAVSALVYQPPPIHQVVGYEGDFSDQYVICPEIGQSGQGLLESSVREGHNKFLFSGDRSQIEPVVDEMQKKYGVKIYARYTEPGSMIRYCSGDPIEGGIYIIFP